MEVREHEGTFDGRRYSCLYSIVYKADSGYFQSMLLPGSIKWADSEDVFESNLKPPTVEGSICGSSAAPTRNVI